MDWRIQLIWIGRSALALAVLIVAGARIWRLFGRDLELDAKRASKAATGCGLLSIAVAVLVDSNSILFIGIGVLFLLTGRLFHFLSESARLDKYQVEEN